MTPVSDPRPVPLIERIMRRVVAAIGLLVVVLLLAALAFVFWANIVLRGERTAAVEAWSNPAIEITVAEHAIVLRPAEGANGSGLVFLPGARVDPYAYLYKLSGIVEEGVTVVIAEPLLNFALLDQRPLDTFTAAAPEVERWLVGGHSLGGVRACQLAEGSEVAGLVLFASYCANDLSATRLDVLSIAGSEDLLSTPQKIADAAHLLPAATNFVTVEGLNHAGFGDYGAQPGDGESTLTDAQERSAITDLLRSVFVAVR